MNLTHYGYIPKVVRSLTNITHIYLNDQDNNFIDLINSHGVKSNQFIFDESTLVFRSKFYNHITFVQSIRIPYSDRNKHVITVFNKDGRLILNAVDTPLTDNTSRFSRTVGNLTKVIDDNMCVIKSILKLNLKPIPPPLGGGGSQATQGILKDPLRSWGIE